MSTSFLLIGFCRWRRFRLLPEDSSASPLSDLDLVDRLLPMEAISAAVCAAFALRSVRLEGPSFSASESVSESESETSFSGRDFFAFVPALFDLDFLVD